MAKGTGLILGGLAAALALAFAVAAGGEKTDDKPDETRDPNKAVPLPTSEAELLEINRIICDCWEATGKPDDMAVLRKCAAETRNPQASWPPIESDHPSVHTLWNLLTQRVSAFLATNDKEAFCEVPDANGIIEVLNEWTSDSPEAGRFYLVKSDPELGGASDTLSRTARRALNGVVQGAGDNSGLRLKYIHCITGGPWNRDLYGSTSFSSNFPDYYFVGGVGLRRAFYPWHEDARAAIIGGKLPKGAVTSSGSRINGVGSSFGLLWLPPIDETALAEGVVTCGTAPWGDGTSSINPPPEIMGQLSD